METSIFVYKKIEGGGGGLRVKIGHHKIGAYAEMGQNRIRGGWGVKKIQKTSDIIYVCSLMLGLVELGCVRLGLIRLGLVRIGLVRLGLVRLGLFRLGLVRLGLVRFS